MGKFIKSLWNETWTALEHSIETCKEHKGKILAGLLLTILLFTIIFFIFRFILPDFLTTPPSRADNPLEEVNVWYYFLSGAGTAALAIIAYIKIGDINKQNQASFLLYIDERWGSPEVLKAREIIHTLYRETQEEYKELLELLPEKSVDYVSSEEQKRPKEFVDRLYKENQEKIKELPEPPIDSRDAFIQAVMGIKIFKISRNTTQTNNFIYLLNFLDFMDTISYLAKDKDKFVDELVDSLDDLCGDSLVFNYKIFKPYIIYKRQKHHQGKKRNGDDRKFYQNFENLHKILHPE